MADSGSKISDELIDELFWLKAQGLSGRSIAKQHGLSPSTVSDYLSGKRGKTGHSGSPSQDELDAGCVEAEYAASPDPAPEVGGDVLRFGRWQDVLTDVTCDALIVDAPYSERTHSNQRHGRRPEVCNGEWVSARGLGYEHMSPSDVADFVASWAPRTRGWFVSITDSELYPAWRDALRTAGRYVFAPIPCVQVGMNVRLAGDGPSNWTCWAVVSRPRSLSKWGTLCGAYYGNPFDTGQNTATSSRRTGVVGSKPLWLMRALVRDYTRPDDLVCDPCAGGGTTLLAARHEGRRAIGAECDEAHFRIASERLQRPFTRPLLPELNTVEQRPIFDTGAAS